MTGSESSIYEDILRRVVAYNEQHGYAVKLLTSNFEWDAELIAALYKERWYIETFFRDIKQLLHIKAFIGTSPNALLTQVWTALCAILLLRYLKIKSTQEWHFSNLVTLLRMNLFNKISLWKWLNYPLGRRKARDTRCIEGLLF